MRKRLTINSVIMFVLVSMLTNTFLLSFNVAVITHELEHHRHAAVFAADPQKHLDLHHALDDHGELDAAMHAYLHAAGQSQSFLLNQPIEIIAAADDAEALPNFNSAFFPESIPNPLFRPPREILVIL